MILYRPVGTAELEFIKQNNYKSFPPRLPEQPIFYPVLNREYACEIAEKWNTKTADRKGYVTEFEVDDEYIKYFEIHTVGAKHHQEFWIPAEELENFNSHIIGTIKVTDEFQEENSRPHLIVSTMHGDTVCHSTSEVMEIVSKSLYNDITISSDSEYPQLSVLTNSKYACLHYFTENQTFQSVGDVNKEITFNAGGTEWTAPKESVVPIECALSYIRIFCEKTELSDLSKEEWTEL